MSNPNLAEVGKPYRFTRDNHPKSPGRKPSRLKKYMKEYDISVNDVINAYATVIYEHDRDELFTIAAKGIDKRGKKVPALIWGLVVAFIADAKRGFAAGGVFNQMMDRRYGKPKQSIEIDGKIEHYINMSPEERKELIDKLIEERMKNVTQK